jgi:hypothetical protein
MKKILKIFLPPILISFIWQVKKSWIILCHRHLLKNNKKLKNKHKGQRCFVLCNGPSVAGQDLSPLKNEVVITVSNGYKHKHYNEIKPKYHVVPHITFGRLTEQDVESWFDEMDSQLLSEILFLSIQQHKLFKTGGGRRKINVHYYFDRGDFSEKEDLPALDRCIPGAQSAPILAIMFAMYMGFEKIYLLGTDHDWFLKRNYSYAFGQTLFAGKDIGVHADGSMPDMRLAEQLPIASALWNQYHELHNIATRNNISIYNATDGGALDEFERVNYEQLMAASKII